MGSHRMPSDFARRHTYVRQRRSIDLGRVLWATSRVCSHPAVLLPALLALPASIALSLVSPGTPEPPIVPHAKTGIGRTPSVTAAGLHGVSEPQAPPAEPVAEEVPDPPAGDVPGEEHQAMLIGEVEPAPPQPDEGGDNPDGEPPAPDPDRERDSPAE